MKPNDQPSSTLNKIYQSLDHIRLKCEFLEECCDDLLREEMHLMIKQIKDICSQIQAMEQEE